MLDSVVNCTVIFRRTFPCAACHENASIADGDDSDGVLADPVADQIVQALVNNKVRQDIYTLLLDTESLSNKARFCSAMFDYENTRDRREKLSKARKIVANFIHPGSQFAVEVPAVVKEDLLANNFEVLQPLKMGFLAELTVNEKLRKKIPGIWEKLYVCSEVQHVPTLT